MRSDTDRRSHRASHLAGGGLTVRIVYAGDVHGSERCFRKFLNAAAFYDAEVLIMGGDITGKVMTPLVEDKPGRFTATVFGRKERVKRPDDLEDLEKQIRFNPA